LTGGPQGNPSSRPDSGDDGSSPTDVESDGSGSGPSPTDTDDGDGLPTQGSGTDEPLPASTEDGTDPEDQTTATADLPSETGPVPCSVDEDCIGLSTGLCALSDTACICLDLRCQPDPDATNSSGGPGQGAETTGSSDAEPTDGESPTVTDPGSSPTDGSQTSCSEDDDCFLDTELCVVAGINICGCVNAVCVQTTDPDSDNPSTASQTQDPDTSEPTDGADVTACTEDSDCVANVGLCLDGLLNLCACVDAVCVLGTGSGDNPSPSDVASQTQDPDNSEPTDGADATSCTEDADCVANVGLCLDGLLNLCACVDAVCVLGTGSGDNTASPSDVASQTQDTDGSTPTDGTEATSCNEDDDCVANVDLCLSGLLNLCTCVDAVCVPTIDPDDSPASQTQDADPSTGTDGAEATSCRQDGDCVANVGLCLSGLLNLCTCVDAVCVPTIGRDGTPASQTQDADPAAGTDDTAATRCSDAGDCVANVGLCLDGLLNLCACVDAVCVRSNPSLINGVIGGVGLIDADVSADTNQRVACTTDRQCTAALGLSALGIYACVDLICELQPTATSADEDQPASETGTDSEPTSTDAIQCSTDQDCVAAIGANALGLFACVDLICQQTATGADADPSTTAAPATNAGDVECSTDRECAVALGAGVLGIFACVDLLCQRVPDTNSGFSTVATGNTPAPTGGSGDTGDDTSGSCSRDSDCTGAGETCSSGTCQVTTPSTGSGNDGSCGDATDCLLSINPLCAAGLCVCLNGVCGPDSSQMDTCTTKAQCGSGKTCQEGACVDEVTCNTRQDCLLDLDLCTSLGICACVNGVCQLA
jgi:predicted cobalt transporter CbtA